MCSSWTFENKCQACFLYKSVTFSPKRCETIVNFYISFIKILQG